MIGTKIESRPTSQWGLGLALAAAAGCLAAFAVSGKPIWLCCASLPLLIAGALWLSRPRRFAADVSTAGLTLADGTAVDFAQIESVLAHSISREPFAIQLVGGSRQVLIPARLNVSSRALFDFLLGVVPVRKKVPRDPDLVRYYQRQQEAFGEQLVWHCPGRPSVGGPGEHRRGRLICAACACAGTIYMIYGANANRSDVLGWGGALLGVGLVGLLITYATDRKSTKSIQNAPAASVILCPLGLALAQADIRGELRWDEVRDVKLRDVGSRVTIGGDTGMPRIDLSVDGAVIPIFDVFEQPLVLIHQRIIALWK